MNSNRDERNPAPWPPPATTVLIACAFTFLHPTAHAQGAGYWHTRANEIVDAGGKPVRIAGINWYGFETRDQIVHGLWAKDYHDVLKTIKEQGYNTVRLPFSNEMVETPIIPTNFRTDSKNGSINADLEGLNSLQIMDRIIAAAGADGLKVILDDHRSEAGDDNERNGLWYTAQYPESSWIADWQSLAARYRNVKDPQGNPIVIGMDLRNEPFMMVGSNATGACWTGDTTSAGCPSTNVAHNWPAAASRAGAAILDIDPNLLIFVEGTDCYDGSCDWQGGNLAGAGQYPVQLPVAGRLVYSAHEYGPDVYPQPWFNASTTSGSLQSVWIHYWAYLSIQKIAPVWVGEFGTTNSPNAIQSYEAGSQGQWFSSLVDFLGKEKQISWTYWAVNGEDDLGVLGNSYDPAPASSLKQQELQSIQFPLNELGRSTREAKASGE